VALVVDPDPDMRAILRYLLAALHYEVIEAERASEVAPRVAGRPLTLVIAELRAGPSTRENIPRELRALAAVRKARLIVCSAWASASDEAAARGAGADVFLRKPAPFTRIHGIARHLATTALRPPEPETSGHA